MPVTLTYPGVYVEEIPSGVRTITGVATSITAIIGWSAKGAVDRAQLILSWSDFEREYGGLNPNSLLGYAVSHFFLNGGQRAYVVRLVAGDAASATIALGTSLTVTAKNPGEWGNHYGITIKALTGDATRFRLAVVNTSLTPQVTVETYENLSVNPTDRRFVEAVINAESKVINVEVPDGTTAPPGVAATPTQLAGGADGAILAHNTAAFESALNPPAKDGGVYHLERVDLFNLLCVPGETTAATLATLQQFCREHRAMLLVDSNENDDFSNVKGGPTGTITGVDAINAAYYFPWVRVADPLRENRIRAFPPSPFVAGLYARTDSARGVWKAPAGTDASLTGAVGVTAPLTDNENGILNPQAINCIRNFSVYGTVVWGARTLQGNDERGSEWKYVPIRRTALFIEESLYRALKWVVFEPNDEPLWAQIRLNVGAFMHDLFRQGAFQGKTPRDAYFVKCDNETTTQSDINRGIVNIIVGFAPLKPAEFVIIKLQQMAGQIEV